MLAFYLLYRFQMKRETWPDFSARAAWYPLLVFPSSANPTKVLKSDSVPNICKNAENGGASQESVDKQGHRATKSRNGAYANNVIPWEAVRVLAGYQKEPQSVFVNRAACTPSDRLQRQIFPCLETSIEEMERVDPGILAGNREQVLLRFYFKKLRKMCDDLKSFLKLAQPSFKTLLCEKWGRPLY